MKNRNPLRQKRHQRPSRLGALVVFLAISLSVFATFSAIAVNVAYMQTSRTELRTTVDAATKAAAQKLNMGGSVAEARQVAIDVAAMNKIAGKTYNLPPEAVVFGNAARNGAGLFTFNEGATPINAVKVRIDRSAASGNSGIPTFFGGLLGVSSYDIAETAVSVKSDRDIALVIDRSGSMMWRLDQDGVYPIFHNEFTAPSFFSSRWAALRNGYASFEQALNATTAVEKVSLASYATDATADLDFTFSLSSISASLAARGSAPINGWTNLGDGMTVGLTQLKNSPNARFDAVKTMVVLTDGIPNVGRDPIEAAMECAEEGIVVHAVSFGNFANTAIMQQIADITGGTYYNAPTESALNDAFRQIAADLPIRLVQ